jgi:hypothetical protein
VEKCCHFFDLMNLITQARPLRVYASGAQDVNHLDERYEGEVPDILDNAFVVVDFEGGCRGLLDLCMFAEASRNEQEIAATGDEGKIECFVPDCDVIIGRRKPREVESVRVPVEERLLKAGFHHGSTYYEHVAFGAAVRSGRPSEVSLADGLLAVAVGQAAELSAQVPVRLRARPQAPRLRRAVAAGPDARGRAAGALPPGPEPGVGWARRPGPPRGRRGARGRAGRRAFRPSGPPGGSAA